MAVRLDGKALAARMQARLADDVAAFSARARTSPCLAVILVGDDPASAVYVRNKARAAGKAGIRSETFHLPASTSQADLLALIASLNARDDVHGILPQMPVPPQIDSAAVFAALDPAKDVDGLSPQNAGLLALGQPKLVPCTPQGVIALIEESGQPVQGAEAVVVGRSNLVGKPTAQLLLSRNATVTLCHSRTKDLAEHTRRADILVTAIGRAGLVTGGMVKPGAVVIDVGTNKVGDRLVGDVDYEAVERVAGWITPVPGGVGPMTITMLLRNTLAAASAIVEGERPAPPG
jgi:methylenetetrahydrofolate dehydrogenase (NADP+)/methenyltetrahydrofolate cyclohydrolase